MKACHVFQNPENILPPIKPVLIINSHHFIIKSHRDGNQGGIL